MEGLKKMDIKVYEVKKGDCIIFRFPNLLTYDTITKMIENIKDRLPEGVKAIIVDESPDLTILKKVD